MTGALVNLSADPSWRQAHTQGPGVGLGLGVGGNNQDHNTAVSVMQKTNPFPPLLAVLRRAAMKDLRLSTLICQVQHVVLPYHILITSLIYRILSYTHTPLKYTPFLIETAYQLTHIISSTTSPPPLTSHPGRGSL